MHTYPPYIIVRNTCAFAKDAWLTLPAVLWVALAFWAFCVLRRDLQKLLSHVVWRLKAGAHIKVGDHFELGPIRALPNDGPAKNNALQVSKDDGTRSLERDRYYESYARMMLVHRILRSNEEGQLYDALIYVVPHRNATLASLQRVDYFFGKNWGSHVFSSQDRAKGFPVVASAYGAFLCQATLVFNDGSVKNAFRYIDFEMGASAPAREQDAG